MISRGGGGPDPLSPPSGSALAYSNYIMLIISAGLLHGDMSQMERNDVITAFKKKEMPILVATDVAGRSYREMML